METKKVSKKGLTGGEMVGIGATVAALGAAAYVLFGPDGKKNKKAIKGWAIKMKGEIIEKLEEAKEISEPVYHKIIDQVQAKYADAQDLENAVKEVKKHWKTMVKDIQPKKKAKAKAKK
ncbi:MAG: hypothetical protein UR85_C0002G0041 [Candidatus Nomurabacteria bacterium GW2011_GWF2_35_66]|nr:MAG: hypothetical protein UR85_C0002G0041 [Candidatus Nomurabacteria bacterium GW2011_GWF2_35_66]